MTPRGQEPVRRQGEQGDSALRENAPAKYAPEGLDAKAKICAASARGGDISLDIPFYRTTPDGDIAEDQMVTATGSYSATAPLGSGQWIMQMVAFRTPALDGTMASSQSAMVKATERSSSRSETIALVVPTVATTLACNPTSLGPRATSSCTLQLNQAAPTGGISVTLTNTNATLTVPGSVTVAAGSTSATFKATAGAITGSELAIVTATLGGSSQSVTIGMRPKNRTLLGSNTSEANTGSARADHAVSALSCLPRVVNAGGQTACELSVSASSTPLELAVSSDSSDVQVPKTITTRANQSSLTFQAAVQSTAKQHSVVVTAGTGNNAVEDTILVLPASGPVVTVPGPQLAKIGETLSFGVSAVDPWDLPIQMAVASMPAGASFDAANGRFDWTPNASQAGKYTITFSAVNSAGQLSSEQVSIEVDAGVPVLDRFAPSCSPGSIAAVTGRWLAAPLSELSDPSGNALDLAGTKVTVNGQYVPVLSVSATRVSFLCPVLDSGTELSIAVQTNSAVTNAVNATTSAVSPAILSVNGAGQNQGLVGLHPCAETRKLGTGYHLLTSHCQRSFPSAY